MSKSDVILVGAGGYGGAYIKSLLEEAATQRCNFKAVIDPYAENAPAYPLLQEANIPIFKSMDDFYAQGSAELAIISTPIHLHLEHCITALKNGSHVLCEKPIVPLLTQIETIQQAAIQYNRIVTVGYQYSFCDALLTVKQAIKNGEYGKPLRFKTYVAWPRSSTYYAKDWAGKIIDKKGNYILDSIITNATSHHFHNMLFLMGDKIEDAAEMDFARAEAYRANPIETFDTIALKGKTVAGCEILFIVTHATNKTIEPFTVCEFENATVTISFMNTTTECVVEHKDGRKEIIGGEHGNLNLNKVLYTLDAINGEKEPCCTPHTAVPHIRMSNALFDSIHVKSFPPELISCEGDEKKYTYVENLHEQLYECFEQWKLPSELGFAWSTKDTPFTIKGFTAMKNL